jgi:hypothetical protein
MVKAGTYCNLSLISTGPLGAEGLGVSMFEGDEQGSGSGRHMPSLYLSQALADIEVLSLRCSLQVTPLLPLTRETSRGAVCLSWRA